MFRSLFGSPATPEEQFRQRVAKQLRNLFPKATVDLPSANPGVIQVGEVQYGLQNLKAKFELSDQEESTFENLVEEHFQFALANKPDALNFDQARALLRPQLMPREYSEQAPLICFPFGKTLATGIVLDAEESYSYVRGEDATRWQIPATELLNIAIGNLDNAVRGRTKMQRFQKEETTWFGIETEDGFGAARILLPGFREFLAKSLGSPFRFAVPNREFLICWNKSASNDFTEPTSEKIKNDFERQPYPLSPNVFEITIDGTITELC